MFFVFESPVFVLNPLPTESPTCTLGTWFKSERWASFRRVKKLLQVSPLGEGAHANSDWFLALDPWGLVESDPPASKIGFFWCFLPKRIDFGDISARVQQ